MASVDEVDLLLIRCLQENPRSSYAQIARVSGVSEATTRRRIEALISEGVITPSVGPDVYRLGYRGSAYIGLRTALDQIDDIAEQLAEMEAVTFVAVTHGRFNILFSVAQPSGSQLDEFIRDSLGQFSGIRDAEVISISRILKLLGEWRVPVEPDEVSRLLKYQRS